MAQPQVVCKYCSKRFSRDKEPYVQIPTGSVFRYAHADCYKKAFESGKETKELTILDPTNSTYCFWCHQAMPKDAADVIPMPQLPNRYVHKKCNEIHPKDDKEALTLYIIKIYKLKDDYIIPRYMLQISQYEKEYNFTYSGMLKALKYWYEIKHNPVDLSRGVGIIPYVYKDAREYYYNLWLADQENQKKDLSSYIPKDIVVVIPSPERKIEKRKLFTFLDEEEEK